MIRNIFYILALSLITAPLALAQVDNSFTTYPTNTVNQNKWIVRDVNPGHQYEENITVENLSNQPIELQLEVIESAGDRNNIRLLENQFTSSLSQWIKPEHNRIHLSALEKKDIALQFNIPANQKLGEYQAVALVSHSQKDADNLSISTRIGNRIYLNVTDKQVLQTNSFTPTINPAHWTLIILSIGGIIYGLLPLRQLNQKPSYE
jgi:uncharacterized membrane protein